MTLYTLADIERLKIERNIKALATALSSYKENTEIRQKAAEALGEIGGVQAVRSLVVGLSKTDMNVHLAIIQALTVRDDALKVVSDLITDPDKKVGERAIEAGIHMAVYKSKNRNKSFDPIKKAIR
jgi:HEAT repeat protein